MRTHVDLFSGIAGFALAAEWAGVQTVAFAEIDSYANRVLERRFPGIRNYGDVRNVPGLSAWLITGGVPCQPASVAGKRRGAEDDRWLWPEALAVVERGNYEWVLFENPTGILSLNDGLEFERVCVALEGQGYEVQPLVIPACGVGALHRRNRVWIVAHAIGKQLRGAGHGSLGGTPARAQREERQQRFWIDVGERSADVADATRERIDGSGRSGQRRRAESSNGRDVPDPEPARLEGNERRIVAQPRERRFDADITGSTWWGVEPDVGRLANGVSDRVGKLRCLGNAIVPQVAYQLIKRMIEAEEQIN